MRRSKRDRIRRNGLPRGHHHTSCRLEASNVATMYCYHTPSMPWLGPNGLNHEECEFHELNVTR